MKRYYELGLIEKKWLVDYCLANWEKCIRYQIEERGEYHPDWMLPNGVIKEDLKEL